MVSNYVLWKNSFDSSQLQEYRGKNILIIHSRKEFYKDTIAGVDCEDVQEEKEIEEASENGIKGSIDILCLDDTIDRLFLAV